jgi:hypothetical protein
MIVLGYATEEPEYLKGRLSGAGVVHYGGYHRTTAEELDELVRLYDDPELHLGLDDTWKQQGLDHYLDWFYTKWSTRGGTRSGKSQMFELLEKVGFME